MMMSKKSISFKNYKTTVRGFGYFEFDDEYGAKCSLQESSLASDGHIWFGVDEEPETIKGDYKRMHLSRKQIKELLPILNYFSLHGRLPKESELEQTQPSITVDKLEEYLDKEVFVVGKTKNISEIAEEILNLIKGEV